MRRSLVLGAALILTLSLSACNNDNNTKDDTIHVESVSVASIHELEVGETFTVGTNTVTVLPDNATDKSYSLSSGDTDVFTTSGYVITAVGEGSATLTVTTTDGGFTDWTTITVKGDTETEPGPEQGGGTGGDDQPGTGGEGGGGEPDTGGEGGDGGGSGGGEPDTGGNEPDPGTELGTIELSFGLDAYTVTENDTVDAVVTVNPSEASVTYEIENTETAYYTPSDNGVTIHGLAAGSTTITATAELEGYTTATATASIVVEKSVPENEDITITLNKSTYTITAGTSEKLDFSVSPEDDAISVNVTSLNTNFVTVSQQEDGWYIYGVAEGSTSVSITASGEGYNSATETVSVTVDKAPDVYTYEFKVANIDQVPTDWKFDDEVTFTLQPQLLVYVNGTLSETKDLTASEASVSIASGDDIVTITGLTISPKGVGTATISVTYTGTESLEGNNSVEFTISVAEDYSTAHKLSIDTTGLETEVTVGGAGISLENRISLITETTALSTNTTTSSSVTAQSGDVTITVSGEGDLTPSGLTLTPANAGEATVTVTWTAYADEDPAPTASFTITVNPKADDTYTMTINNQTELESAWYTEDGSRTISLSIVNDNTSDVVNESNENVNVIAVTSGVVTIDGLTLTPVGKGTSLIYVEWTEHTEAHATFEVSVDEYTYSLSITNAEDFAGTWSIEDGAKTLEIELKTNNPSLSSVTASQTNVSITGWEDGFTTTDGGFTLTPIATGTYTITATWIDHTTATASITVNVDDTIKPVSITMSPSSLELEVGQQQSLTATVFGASGVEATNQGVEWSSNPTGIVSISGTGNTVTVTANEYASATTITARSTADSSVYAECTVTTAEALETGAPIVLPQDKEVVVSSPDDNGVYVLGTEGFASYYETGTTTSSYDAATPVRVLAADGGYNLMIDGQYLAVNDTAIVFKDDISEAAIFSISTTGITYGGTALAINTDGELLISSIADAVYLVDIVLEENDSLATSGTFYISCLWNGTRKYVDGTNSVSGGLRLTTSTDTTNAVEFTVEDAGNDQYYIKRVSDGYYLKMSTSSNVLSFTSSSSDCALTYNENGFWTETADDTGKILAYNSTVNDGEISSYASSNSSNSSYAAAQLYAVPSLPELKGITISAPEAELMLGGEEKMSYTLYPTCYTSLTLNWDVVDEAGDARSDVTITNNGTVDISSSAALGAAIITASYGGITSNTATINVTGLSYIESEKITFSEQGFTNSQTLDGTSFVMTFTTITVAKASGSTAPTYYDTGTGIRIYSNNTITFELHEGVTYPISKIEMTYSASGYTDNGSVTSNGSASTSGTTVTITPTTGFAYSGNTIVFTGGGSSSGNTHARLQTITIYYSQS